MVPPLDLYGLPEYETSSDEEDNPAPQQNKNPQYLQESMKYIEEFYTKMNLLNPSQYHQSQQSSVSKGAKGSQGSSKQQISYFDHLSQADDSIE